MLRPFVDVEGLELVAVASMTSPVAVVDATIDQASAATASQLIVPGTTDMAAAAVSGPVAFITTE